MPFMKYSPLSWFLQKPSLPNPKKANCKSITTLWCHNKGQACWLEAWLHNIIFCRRGNQIKSESSGNLSNQNLVTSCCSNVGRRPGFHCAAEAPAQNDSSCDIWCWMRRLTLGHCTKDWKPPEAPSNTSRSSHLQLVLQNWAQSGNREIHLFMTRVFEAELRDCLISDSYSLGKWLFSHRGVTFILT